MHRFPALAFAILVLTGCRAGSPTVNPFLARTTVPAPGTGAASGNAAPYYPANGVPPQYQTPPPGPYNGTQPGWAPRSGSTNTGAASASLAMGSSSPVAPANAPYGENNGVNLNGGASAAIDSGVRLASAETPAAAPAMRESSVRVPTDGEPLVQARRPIVPSAELNYAGPNNAAMAQTMPVTGAPAVDARQPFVQTLVPAEHSTQPVTALASSNPPAAPLTPATTPARGVPAALVYGGTPTGSAGSSRIAPPATMQTGTMQAMTVQQMEIQPGGATAALRPTPANPLRTTTTTAPRNPVLAMVSSQPTLAAPRVESRTEPVAVTRPVEITDLPVVRSTPRVAN